jgi:recombinational DNA repair protein (RecF pathway)
MNRTIPSQDLRWAKLVADPTCRDCGQTKTPADFPRKAVDYACTACRGKYAIRLYHKQRASMTPQQLQDLKDRINERQNRRRAERLANMSPDDAAAFRAAANANGKRHRDAVRDAVYIAYGGYRCACCGEAERAFLSIDHVNNDGAAHKRECKLRTGEQLYRWLARNQFPAEFQILCMNCQWGKRNNKGVCPHVSGKV